MSDKLYLNDIANEENLTLYKFKMLKEKVDRKIIKPSKPRINYAMIIFNFINNVINNVFSSMFTNKHKVPITKYKIIGSITFPLIIIVILVYIIFLIPHNINNDNIIPTYTPNTNNGDYNLKITPLQVTENKFNENKIVTINDVKVLNENNSNTIINNSSITVNPTITLTVTPTSTPKPTVIIVNPNNQYIDNFNFVTVKGLNTDFKIEKEKTYKLDSNINIKANIQNLNADKISRLDVTATISKWNIDKSSNQPYIELVGTKTLLSEQNLNLKQYENYKIDTSVKLDSRILEKGEYLIVININGNNGGNCKIQEQIIIN